MKTNKRFIYLAKLGILESTDENGDYEIQRIDDPEDFRKYLDFELGFTPPLLKDDNEAKQLFKSLTHNQLEQLN